MVIYIEDQGNVIATVMADILPVGTGDTLWLVSHDREWRKPYHVDKIDMGIEKDAVFAVMHIRPHLSARKRPHGRIREE